MRPAPQPDPLRPPRPAAAPHRPLVGVVGGMGPLASAELLRTVYQDGAWAVEQEAPRILLWSDPDVVDRTEAIDGGDLDALREAVERSVSALAGAGADRIMIACLTAHHVLPALPPELTARCASLVDIVFDSLERTRQPQLLLGTSGTARAGILTAHDRHPAVADRIVTPDADDQETLHRLVYRIKRGAPPSEAIAFLKDALPRYGAAGFVAACTELHLVTREITAQGMAGVLPFIDPLTIAAERIRNGEL